MRRSISALGLNLPVAGEVGPAPRPPPREPFSPPLPRRAAGEDEPRYTFDEQGRQTGVLAPGSSEWLLFERGECGELRIRAESGHVYLDANANTAELDNGVVEALSFDAAGRPARFVATAPDGESVLDLGFAYDGEGRIARLGGTAVAYEGDVVAGAAPAAKDVSYDFDERGNRIARRAPGEDLTSYAYDRDDRLVEVRREGRTIVCYGYDGAGRRARREDAAGIVLRHYDLAGNLLAETDEHGRARATYICAGLRCLARIDGPVGRPAAEWFHLDHAGSAWAVTDAAGAVAGRRAGPLDQRAPGPYMRRFRDPATGFYDFGARDFDPESGCFTTPDSYTFATDDPRLLADPRRDPWGGDGPQRTVLEHWAQTPALRDRYAFCLGDPVNNLDLDGHSAWWFFLTIPSSLTWALPNTVIALILVIVNLIMEIIGWIALPFVAWARGASVGLASYPWGLQQQTGTRPPNPFDLNDRNHFWMNFDASARQGVPWAMINGSFCSAGRAYALGNVVFIEDIVDSGNEGDTNQRFIVPDDPDLQLNRQDALRQHEMQHTFQYAYLGPLFHCMPIPLVARIIENLAQGNQDIIDRTEWWKKIDLGGGLMLTVGGLVWLLTFTKVKPEDVAKWIDPATWWQQILPFRWAEIATQAISFNSLVPGVGVYEIDLLAGGGQNNSWFERDAGAASGDTYGTVIEAEEDEIFVGQFARIIGADVRPQPGTLVPRTITWSVSPDAPLPTRSPGTKPAPDTSEFDPTNANNFIPLNSVNTPPVQVINGGGLYFHATAPGTYAVTGAGSSGSGIASETVNITVKDISVVAQTSVFVCQSQLVAVSGDSGAAYTLNLATDASGATVAGLTYTAGQNPGTDVIEVRARYAANAGAFATYGDNGVLGGFDWVVRTINIVVTEPAIDPLVADLFVGASVDFTFDLNPQDGSSTALVPGSRYDAAARRFTAGRGAIATQQVETVTFQYGCRTYTAAVTVRPILVTATPATVAPGATSQIGVNGGTGPFTFEIALAGTSGPNVDAAGVYTAGAAATPVTDVVTVTDANGGRGTVSIAVQP